MFGSFANDIYTDESDFDFYVVVRDGVTDLAAEAAKAYKAVRTCMSRSVDIFVGTQDRFEQRKDMCMSVESEVYRKGILLYDAGSEGMPKVHTLSFLLNQ